MGRRRLRNRPRAWPGLRLRQRGAAAQNLFAIVRTCFPLRDQSRISRVHRWRWLPARRALAVRWVGPAHSKWLERTVLLGAAGWRVVELHRLRMAAGRAG